MTHGVAELAAIVAQSNALATDLLDVLNDERKALAAGDVENIDLCGQRKSACVARMDELDTDRQALCSALGLGDAELDAVFRQHGVASEAAAGWQRFLHSLASCREANAVNGQITLRRRRHVEKALHILRGGQFEDGGIYGPDGRDHVTTATVLGQA